MPALTIPRHETFARAVAGGATQTAAARAAGYSERRLAVTGSQLAQRPDVKARIKELHMEIQAAFVQTVANESYTLTDALKQAREAFQVAREKQNGAAMTGAVALMAKLAGLLIERRMEVRSIDEYSDDELDQLLAAFETKRVIGTAAEANE